MAPKGENMLYFIDLTAQGRECSGWILYTQPESIRNRAYIDRYRVACEKYGLSIQLGIYEPPREWDAACRQRLAGLAAFGKARFAINRTRDFHLAQELEKLGVQVYNPSQIAELGNDKAKACQFMQAKGVPVMPAAYHIQAPPPWYPAVVKSRTGHGGTQVYYIKDEKGWQDWKQGVCQPNVQYMVQQAASDLGRDVRVYVIGSQIIAAVMRSSTKDFRSNYCLGGNVELYDLDAQGRRLVGQALSGLTVGMAGIDFIFHHGQMVFNELEDMAGARSLYLLSDCDIVDEYINFIRKDMQGTVQERPL